MTVLMTLRLQGDATAIEKLAAEDPAMFKAVVERAKSHGLIRHRFYATATEILVVDEWPDEASFEAFFASSPEVADIMAAAGVTGEPAPEFWRLMDVDDHVG